METMDRSIEGWMDRYNGRIQLIDTIDIMDTILYNRYDNIGYDRYDQIEYDTIR